MSAIDDFKNCDTLRITNLSGDMHGGGENHPIHGADYCVSKKAGTLDLDLPIPSVPGLVLQAQGQAGAANSTIAWNVDQDLDVQYMGHHLTHVKGTVVAGVRARAATQGTTCNGDENRSFQLALTPQAGSSTLTITVGAFVFTIPVKVDQIAIAGIAGTPVAVA